MPAPLIGITTNPINAPDRHALDLLLSQIVSAVERAGGLPVLIPLELSEDSLRAIYARLDGVLIPGGGDVDPTTYNGDWHEKIGGVDAERDRTEMTLARLAADDDKPYFGICRGAQVLNVALGGALYPDVSEHPGVERHTYYPGLPFDLRPHAIDIAPASTLERIVGGNSLSVNSLHHQAIRDVPPALKVVARAPDGVVEAVEVAGHPFALGVQWHPEALPDAPEMQALFQAFVAACRARMSAAG